MYYIHGINYFVFRSFNKNKIKGRAHSGVSVHSYNVILLCVQSTVLCPLTVLARGAETYMSESDRREKNKTIRRTGDS